MMISRRFTNRNNTPLPFRFIRNKITTTFLPLLQCDPKYFVLLLLVLQNTALVLLMRYSRTRPGTLYLSSTAVCCDEGIKLITCLGIIIAGYLFRKPEQHHDLGSVGGDVEARKDDDDMNNDTNISNNNESFRSYMGQQLKFDIRMAGLALFYTVQKNLLYLAISNLDAAVFQVTYQLKVLTTALFSVLLLKRKLTRWKIAALLLLTLGVALVQLDNELSSKSKNGLNNASSISYQEQSRWVGILAVLAACCTSGFGGVYFELVLKPNNNNSSNETKENSNGASTTPLIVKPRPPSQEQQQPSVWAKNVQLSAFGLLIALFTSFSKDHEAIRTNGFFGGYDRIVVLVVSLQAFGGLIVAAIIKYADNILKNFATGAGIVASTLVNSWVFGFWISRMFILGCAIQFVAIWLYSKEDVGGSVVGNSKEEEEEEEEEMVGRRQQESNVNVVGPMNSGIALISRESQSDLGNQGNGCRRR